jgi:hypothetical protein
VARLEQLALEQEAPRHVVGGALDRHRVALARRAVLPEVGHAMGLGELLAGADRGEQGAVADEVGIAADRAR